MFAKNDSVLNKIAPPAVLLITLLSFASPVPAADSDGGLKAITPQFDPNAEQKQAVRKPLQAGLQMNQKIESPQGKSLRATAADQGGALKSGLRDGGLSNKKRGGAKNAPTNQLRANANNSGLNANATSGFGIIGVKFIITLGRPPVVNRVFAGTPAAELGLQNGDAIVAVDGVPTYGLVKEEVYDLIVGSPGTKVNLSIMRSGDFKVFTCTRMDINDLTDPIVRRDYLMSM